MVETATCIRQQTLFEVEAPAATCTSVRQAIAPAVLPAAVAAPIVAAAERARITAQVAALPVRGAEAAAIAQRVELLTSLYREPDNRPWLVGFSGGKDSSATLLLVWMAVSALDPDRRTRPVHVISTDTGVENPVMAAWVTHSLQGIRTAAAAQRMPVSATSLAVPPQQAFLVQLLGRGYAPPRNDFRWCTPRLKVAPGNAAARARSTDGSVLFLGTRKDESAARKATMESAEAKGRIRPFVSPNVSLGHPQGEVCSPIEDWSTEQVWNALSGPLPWGVNGVTLMMLYDRAAAAGECGFAVDEGHSCGTSGSRFGCHTCTLVGEDKTLAALAAVDHPELAGLVRLRNELADFARESAPARTDAAGVPLAWVNRRGTAGYQRHPDEPVGPRRDPRRKRHAPDGRVTWRVDVEDARTRRAAHGGPDSFAIPGSLTPTWCAYFLERYLTVGDEIRRTAVARLADPATAPTDRPWWEHLVGFDPLPVAHLEAIRSLWADRGVPEDPVPTIYMRATLNRWPGAALPQPTTAEVDHDPVVD
jgi:putative sulfurtransferase DndC